MPQSIPLTVSQARLFTAAICSITVILPSLDLDPETV